MRKLGSPFQQGTPGSLVFIGVLTLLMTCFYITSSERELFYLMPILFGVGGFTRAYYKYRKLRFQDGRKFIGDLE